MKRTCGECEHWLPSDWERRGVMGRCRTKIPMWVIDIGDDGGDMRDELLKDTDATHCEAFLPMRKDDG